jgi:hypothetical protein
MGWTSSSEWNTREKIVKYVSGLEYWNPAKAEVLDFCVRKDAVYLLVTDLSTNKNEIFVTLIQEDSVNKFGYKPLSEHCHPLYYDCPERILKLSDSDSVLALEWRKVCRDTRRKKVKVP